MYALPTYFLVTYECYLNFNGFKLLIIIDMKMKSKTRAKLASKIVSKVKKQTSKGKTYGKLLEDKEWMPIK